MAGFVVTFPSSYGVPAYLVHPARFGEEPSRSQPWMRATHVASVFSSPAAAQEAIKALLAANFFTAPEINGGLERRLGQAQIIPVDVGISVELYRRG